MKTNKKQSASPTVQYIYVQSASASRVTDESEIKDDVRRKAGTRSKDCVQNVAENESQNGNKILPCCISTEATNVSLQQQNGSASAFHEDEPNSHNKWVSITPIVPVGVTSDQEDETKLTEVAINDCGKSNSEQLEKGHSLSKQTQQTHSGSRSLLSLIRRRQQRRFRVPQQSTAVRYLQYFLSFLYFVGMSPIPSASAKKLPKWITKLQMVLFWLLALTSILQALDELKYGWIQFRVDENMLNFVSLGFYFANLLTRVYCIKLLVTSAKSASCLMETIDNVNGAGHSANMISKRIAIGIGTLSLALAMVSTVFGYTELNQWSFKAAILERARELHESIFVWTSTNYDNVTLGVYEQYQANLTIRAGLFATAGNFLAFCGTMHACVLLDLWLIVSVQIYILQFQFTTAFIETKAGTGRCPLSIHWKYYKRLRAVCEQNDLVFGKLLKMVHMQNLLLFGNFLLELLKKKSVDAMFLTDVLSVLKVSITYYLVQKSTEKNEMYEQCVIDCSECGNTIEMDGKEMNVGVLLYDMKRHPIGIGRGDFYVNETFVLKLAAAVWSVAGFKRGWK